MNPMACGWKANARGAKESDVALSNAMIPKIFICESGAGLSVRLERHLHVRSGMRPPMFIECYVSENRVATEPKCHSIRFLQHGGNACI